MKLRDDFQKLIYVVIDPFVKGLIHIGLTPNMVTFIGFLLNVCAAYLFVVANPVISDTYAYNYSMIMYAGIVLFIGSMFDMLDGQVARIGNMKTTFGAMFDSILDRYSEMITLLAISYLFFSSDSMLWGLVTFLAMLGSLMVSYVRARAEGLGLECKVGFLQRPERVVITFVAAFLSGLLECIEILQWAMAFIAVFANITAFWRIIYCKRQIEKNNSDIVSEQ